MQAFFTSLTASHLLFYHWPKQVNGQARSLCKEALPMDMGSYEQIGDHYYHNLPHILDPKVTSFFDLFKTFTEV